MEDQVEDPRHAKLAEGEFEKFCNSVGAVCNRVQDDQTGWDFLVEFQPINDPDVPHDMRPAPQRVFVQVKHSIQTAAATELKLSNALRYAEDEQPWFIVFFAYEPGALDPHAVYLRHVWKPLMAEALRASRDAHVEGAKLNREKVRLRFEQSERCTGNPLDEIRTVLRTIGAAYGEQKSQLARGLGYEEGYCATGSLTLAEGVTEADVVDLMLGLRESLPLADFRVVDHRFGRSTPLKATGPAIISVEPTAARECLVAIRKGGSSEEISWPGKVYTPGIEGLAREHQRMRVCAGPVELMFDGGGTAKFRWSMPAAERHSIAELSRQLAFRSWSDVSAIELEIWSEGQALSVQEFKLDNAEAANAPYWAEAQKAFGTLMSIVPMSRVPESLAISIEDLFEELDDLLEFAKRLDGTPMVVNIGTDGPPIRPIDDVRRLIMPLGYNFADHAFIAVVEYAVTNVAYADNRLCVRIGDAAILRGRILPGACENHRNIMDSEIKWAEDRANRANGAVLSLRLTNPASKGEPGASEAA